MESVWTATAQDPRPPALFSKLLEVPDTGAPALDAGDDCCRTPTAQEFRIPELLTCPPAPKKRRPEQFSRPKQFFFPPNLDLIFALETVPKVK